MRKQLSDVKIVSGRLRLTAIILGASWAIPIALDLHLHIGHSLLNSKLPTPVFSY
jgi:hypothetical protein